MKITSYIFFEKNIQTIKTNFIKKYLLEFFLLKNILIRVIGLLLITLICGLVFFLMRYFSLEDNWKGVVFNRGFAWGIGDNWDPWIGYLTKIIPLILLLIVMLIFNEWYIFIPVCVVFVNSLFNVIDKSLVDIYQGQAYYDAVVDNISWVGLGFTNNIADIFIICGAILTVLGLLWEIKNNLNSRKDKQDDKEHNCPEI